MKDKIVVISCDCGKSAKIYLDPILEKPIILKDLFEQLKKDFFESSPICRGHFGLSLNISEFVTKEEILDSK